MAERRTVNAFVVGSSPTPGAKSVAHGHQERKSGAMSAPVPDDRLLDDRVPWPTPIQTERLDVRPLVEGDRATFVDHFADPTFMVYGDGALDPSAASAKFDRMLAWAGELPFAKQPVVERSTGRIVGYTGAGRMEIDGVDEIEWGYRFVASARGRGYATEASAALLRAAAAVQAGRIVAVIDPTNRLSQRVAAKLGFEYDRQSVIMGELCNVYHLELDRPSG